LITANVEIILSKPPPREQMIWRSRQASFQLQNQVDEFVIFSEESGQEDRRLISRRKCWPLLRLKPPKTNRMVNSVIRRELMARRRPR